MTWREIGLLVAMVAAWFVLNRWVLPACGVGTCMSGCCGTCPLPTETEQTDRLSGAPQDEGPLGGELRYDASGTPVPEPAEPFAHTGEGGLRP